MRPLHVDDRVHLTHDVPFLSLRQGDAGVVRSVWFAPADAYEVEFRPPGSASPSRCVLSAGQVEADDDGPQHPA